MKPLTAELKIEKQIRTKTAEPTKKPLYGTLSSQKATSTLTYSRIWDLQLSRKKHSTMK